MAMDLQRLMSLLRQCMQRYDMVSAGDKIAVGLSGGKDSLTLLMGLKHLQRFYPVPYGLCAIHVGSGAPGSEADVETMRRFIGLYNAQSDERDPAYAQPDYADDHSGVVPGKAVLVNVYCAEYKQTDRRQVQNYRQEQHRPAARGAQLLFLVVSCFLFHVNTSRYSVLEIISF